MTDLRVQLADNREGTTMLNPSGPLRNLGHEAFEAVLHGDAGTADRRLQNLKRSELADLDQAATRLAGMARALIQDTWPSFKAASDA